MKAIVSLANNRGNYQKALSRLGESLLNNFDGEFVGFMSESAVGAPKHKDNPYAFKIYAIEHVLNQGYKQILWLDSSVFAIKNVQPVFDEIAQNNFIFQEAGQFVGRWANDKTLQHFGLTRDEAMDMLMLGNAGLLGINFDSEIGREFFRRWKESMLAGCFVGEWKNDKKTESQDERCDGHRHDMSCSSIIANQMGLTYLYKRGNELLQYAGLYDETANETIIFKAQGM